MDKQMVVHPYSGILFSKTEKNEALYVCSTTAECLTQQKYIFSWGFPDGLDSKEYTCNAGDLGSVPGLGSSPGEGNGNSLQYACLGNPMDRGVWRATVHGVIKSQTRLSD